MTTEHARTLPNTVRKVSGHCRCVFFAFVCFIIVALTLSVAYFVRRSRKMATSYCLRCHVLSVRLSVRPRETSRVPQDGLSLNLIFEFVFLTVHPGTILGKRTILMHNYVIQNVYYYNPLHVSSNSVLIIRRSNCINTASGIVLSVSDRPVCRLGGNFLLNLHTRRSLTQNTIPDAVLIQFDLLMMIIIIIFINCN